MIPVGWVLPGCPHVSVSPCSQSLSSLDGQDEDSEDDTEDEDSSVSDRSGSGASYQERSKSPVVMARRGKCILYM